MWKPLPIGSDVARQDIDLKKMTLEELETLKAQIEDEIRLRAIEELVDGRMNEIAERFAKDIYRQLVMANRPWDVPVVHIHPEYPRIVAVTGYSFQETCDDIQTKAWPRVNNVMAWESSRLIYEKRSTRRLGFEKNVRSLFVLDLREGDRLEVVKNDGIQVFVFKNGALTETSEVW